MAQNTYVSPKVVASGTTFAQLQAGGLAGVVANLVTANVALADPTVQATATATGGGATGGNLAAGTYYASYTFVNGFGETLAGSSESAQLTVGATNIPRVTFPALPSGASSIRLYLTAVGGASGTETLYATGITGTTFDCSFAAGSDPLALPPTVNTTAASNAAEYVGMPTGGLAQHLFDAFGQLVTAFIQGDPIALNEAKKRHHKLAAVLKLYQAATDEIGVLIAANTGTLTTTTTGLGGPRTVRTFP